jgi:polysaccharide export outer membrane protein
LIDARFAQCYNGAGFAEVKPSDSSNAAVKGRLRWYLSNPVCEEFGCMVLRHKSHILALFVLAGLVLVSRQASWCEDSSYVLGPEDVVQVKVARHPELDVEATVLPDGTVAIPRAGRVAVQGLTIAQAQKAIEDALSKVLVSPQVTLNVKATRPNRVYVVGQVTKPGMFELKPGWRVAEALAEAGWLKGKPELARASLFRGDKVIPIDLMALLRGEASANLPLQPGDVLSVQDAPTVRIYVNGQGVKNPGEFDVTEGLGVVEAFALAGGATPNAALRKAVVVRAPKPGQPREQIPVDLYGPLVLGKPAPDIKLQAGDTLIVPENNARVAVFGLVKNPGYYPLPESENFTVADAIALAGGQDKRAELKNVLVIRRPQGNSGMPTVITADVKSMLRKADPGGNPVVQDGDIIFVPETRKPDVFGKILPALTNIGLIYYYLPGGR